MLERTYGDTSPLWVEESAQLLDILIPVLHFTGVLTTIGESPYLVSVV